jgi:hypothetical protein
MGSSLEGNAVSISSIIPAPSTAPDIWKALDKCLWGDWWRHALWSKKLGDIVEVSLV